MYAPTFVGEKKEGLKVNDDDNDFIFLISVFFLLTSPIFQLLFYRFLHLFFYLRLSVKANCSRSEIVLN